MTTQTIEQIDVNMLDFSHCFDAYQRGKQKGKRISSNAQRKASKLMRERRKNRHNYND